MTNNLIFAFVVLGAILIFFSSLQIVGNFAHDKFKWPIRGIIVFYWLLYLAGAVILYASTKDCSGSTCNIGAIGGGTLIVFGYSAVTFYVLTVYSFISLRSKMAKLNFSKQITDKINTRHAEAVIVFFFTTWVAAGFVYLIHQRSSKVLKEAKNNPGISKSDLEKRLSKVFGRKITLKKRLKN